MSRIATAVNLIYSDTPGAEKLLENARTIGLEIKSEPEVAIAETYLAFTSFLLSKGNHSLSQLQKNARVLEHHADEINLCANYNYQATLFDSYGDFDEALEMNLKAYRLAEKLNLEKSKADCCNTAGNIYYRLNQPEEAKKYFTECLSLREKINDEPGIASVSNQLGRLFLRAGNTKDSILNYEKSHSIRKKLNDESSLAWTEMGMANVFLATGQTEKAKNLFEHALKTGIKFNDLRVQLYCYIGIGELLQSENNFELSVANFNDGLKIAEILRARMQEAEIYKHLADLEEKRSDATKALDYLKKHIELKEEILNSETTEKIQQLRTSHKIENAEREAEIHRLKNVELKSAYEKISEYADSISDSIHYALRIQKAILPDLNSLPELKDKFFILNHPKDVVSGDYYWMAKVMNKNQPCYLLILADCTGHGVPGAFMSMIGSAKLNHIVFENKIIQPAEILFDLNHGIRKFLKQTSENAISKDGMEMGICLYDPADNTIEYAGSNRPLLISRKKDDLVDVVDPDKITIGGFFKEGELKFIQHKIYLEKGDYVYLYSDGVPDQFGGPKNKKFSTKRLKEMVLKNKNGNPAFQSVIFEKEMMDWKGNEEQTDDILLMGLEI